MEKLTKKNLVFLGAPGAGKGTVAKEMVKTYGLCHISTGDILRAEVAAGTPAGKEAEVLMKAGKLVPDELVTGMVRSRIAQPDCANGFILDGFPRTVKQAELLEEALKEMNNPLDRVVYLYCDDDTILKRLTARVSCPKCDAIFNKIFMPPKVDGRCDHCNAELVQRADDTLETAQKRLKVFYEQTSPLLDLYRERGLVYERAELDLDKATRQLLDELEK